MATFNDLKTDRYYLIKDNDTPDVSLVYVLMETEKAVFLEYEDEMETLVWKKKSDSIGEIIEELTDEQADLYESIVFEDEEEDEEISWDEMMEDDDEDEEDDDEDDEDDDITPGGGGKTRKLFR